MTGFSGIDVSNNNGELNIAEIRPGFVIAKASEGTNYADPTYAYYSDEAPKNGARLGAYHFLHAENNDGANEAEYFIQCARPRNFLSLWVDYETYSDSPDQDAATITTFINRIKSEFPSQRVGIYTNSAGLARLIPNLWNIPYDAWWYANPSTPLSVATPVLDLAIHQGGTTTYNGVTTDLDWSFWTPEQMTEFATW